MTDTDASLLAKLGEIQARVEKATKGPWRQGPHYVCDVESPLGQIRNQCIFTPQGEADAAFIAHAREDIPYLLAALRRSGEALRRLQEEIEQLSSIQVGSPDPTYFEATPLIRRQDVLAILSRQSGAEGTEAGGRSQPLAPTIEDWQPIATAPKDGTQILVAFGNAVWVSYWFDFGPSRHGIKTHGFAGEGAITHAPPTHWRPFPAPPVSDAERATRSDVSSVGSPQNLSTHGDRS